MSYEVWFDNGKGFWVGYHSFTHLMKAKIWMERFQKAHQNINVEMRRRVHASYS